LKKDYNIIDATLGGGGHSQKILEKTTPQGKLIGIDWDEGAIQRAKENLSVFGDRAYLIRGNYKDFKDLLKENEVNLKINGILIDLGLSMYQLDERDRGFTFKGNENLDMRYDRDPEKINAEQILNEFPEEKIADIFYQYGEERLSRQIASLIIKRREQERIDTPEKLVRIIELIYKTKFRDKSKKHPATKVFQALRIYINQEFENIKEFLPNAIDVLEKGGRLAVITFHSLEDKIVKECFKKESRGCICPVEIPECRCGHQAKIKIINRKVIVPGVEEIKNNPASRSAKLRVVEKI
jgi:16S rRNA (cytosine1402-N4)-methyltransferase